MVKGVSIKFKSYKDSVSNILKITKFENEIAKHPVIVLKPFLRESAEKSTSPAFVEQVLRFCLDHKSPEAQIFIAEGADGEDTMELFDKLGYKRLVEQYSVSLIDLNTADTEEIMDDNFLKFQPLMYPQILKNSFLISLPKLSEDKELEMLGGLSNMIGAFPAKFYSNWFSPGKSKLKKVHPKYAIHDILRCKMPDLSIIDASAQGHIILGNPIEIEKQAATLIGKDWRSIQYLRLVDESFASTLNWLAKKQEAKAQKAESELSQ
ncbi:MAG: DUF362 domain-containing protein [Nanoarchaeota archaeon]